MGGNEQPLHELEKLTQDIINRFETALNKSTTSELSSVVDGINKSLEKQASLIQNISINSTDRVKQTKDEFENVKYTTSEIEKQSRLYKNILESNEDITENWEQIIKKSSMVGKNYKDINKQQKQYLASLNLAIKKEKQLSNETLKRMKNASRSVPKSKKNKLSGKGGVPQFVDVQGLTSTQIGIESLTGGKPYFASHPEMGVPLGLFNTKDEPNRSSRISAIQKYGIQGSISGVFPQYADDLPVMNPNTSEADLGSAVAILMAKIVAKKAFVGLLDAVVEIIDVVTKFGDKIEQFSGEADESIRSSIQGTGTIMANHWMDLFQNGTPLTRASYFQQSMERAAFELNIEDGVFASYEMLGNLQKSFTQFSKTNVLLGKDDLKNMIYLQKTFDLASDDVAEIQSTFIDLGMSSQDMIKYSDDLSKEARKYGVSASQLLKDSAKLMKLGVQYRFKGGVKDFEKMQVYAANAKFDIEKAYNVMDTAMSVEGAIDLASQLQVLGGSFSDISSLDLFAAAQSGDMTSFTKNLIDRFKQDTGRFGKIGKSGMFEFTPQGRQLLKAFEGIDGFDMGTDLVNVLTKAGKEAEIRKKILGGRNSENFLKNYSLDEQKTIIENIAHGSVNTLNLTGQDLKNDVIDFNSMVLDKMSENMSIGPGTAKGAQSTKDQKDLNEQIVKLESQQVQALDGVKIGLESLKSSLLYVGESINLIGMEYFKSPFFKKMEVLTEYLNISLEEAVLFNGYFKYDEKGNNTAAAIFKAFMGIIANPEDMISNAAGKAWDTVTAPMTNPDGDPVGPPEPPSSNKYGGILKAAGGMVMGSSHLAGGVRGTGKFNNVEVEGGEAIINKKSTEMFLPLLSKLNELGGGVSFGGNMNTPKFGGIGNNKTINVKISGNLNFNSKNQSNSKVDVGELAEEIDKYTSGKSYGGVY